MTGWMRRIGAALLLAILAGQACAHVTDLAVLSLREVAPGRYLLAWEMKPNTETGSGLEPVFPNQCTRADATVDCGERGLVGPLSFERIGKGQSAAMFKIRAMDGATRVYTVTPSDPVARISPAFDADNWGGLVEIASAYVSLGVEHILQGIDHLLFVLGLIWISRGRWMLLKTITAFTVAHTVTLGAVTFGWIGVPESLVNALIALSIVFIAVEALAAREGAWTWTLRFPWVVSFGFGLLHGAGFASALSGLGLPEDAIPLALLSFNLGVEIGQIVFVLLALALAWSWRIMLVNWPRWAPLVPTYAIGGLAAFWFCDRVDIMLWG